MGGCSPKPRKLNAVSARIMEGIASVETTIIWPIHAGMRCLKIMRELLAPINLAAVM
jgi:hypothetical protein